MQYKDYLREKYKHTEKVVEAEGYPCILKKSKGKPLKDYRIYGNSAQDGEPTPDVPVEVVPVGDKSKNLYNPNDLYISVEAGEYYQIEYPLNSEDSYKTLSIYDENKTLIKHCMRYSYKGYYYKHIVKPQTKGFIVVYVNAGYDVPNLEFKLMVTKGLTVTLTDAQNTSLDTSQYIRVDNALTFPEYEPYGKYKIPVCVGDIITNIYLDEPLGYADYIDFKGQKVVRNDVETPIELPPILTPKGDCTITTSTEIAPSNIWCKYIK